MSEARRKVEILLSLEFDQAISDDEAEEIAAQLESIPREELWSALAASADVDANIVAVSAEVAEVALVDDSDEDWEEPSD